MVSILGQMIWSVVLVISIDNNSASNAISTSLPRIKILISISIPATRFISNLNFSRKFFYWKCAINFPWCTKTGWSNWQYNGLDLKNVSPAWANSNNIDVTNYIAKSIEVQFPLCCFVFFTFNLMCLMYIVQTNNLLEIGN